MKRAATAEDVKSQLGVDAQTFAQTIGHAVWLMSMAKDYRHREIGDIDHLISAAILMRSFKLYQKDKKPIAFLTWARVSDEVKAKLDVGEYKMELKDWRSGEHLVVVDCISPFLEKEQVVKEFLQKMSAETAN